MRILKQDSFNEFYRIKLEHQELKKYKDTSKQHMKVLYDTFKEHGMCDLYFSEYNNKYLSGAFIWKYKDTIYYVYGASTEESRNLNANNLLHWEIIKNANKEGYKNYNMWGGTNKKDTITRFKMRFSKDAKLISIPVFKKALILKSLISKI